MQMNLIDELKVMGLEQDGYIFEEIGENLLLLNKAEESKNYFRSAYEMLSKDIWLVENRRSPQRIFARRPTTGDFMLLSQ